MKQLLYPRWLRAGLLCSLILFLFAGCLEKRLIWSPDGSRAIVISKDGLLLCAARGQLSELLVPDVYCAAWAGDSEHLVLARHRKLTQWEEIAPLAGDERVKIEASADEVWRRTAENNGTSIFKLEFGTTDKLVKIALRDRHGSQLMPKLATQEWQELERLAIDSSEVLSGRIVDGRVALGPVLHHSIGDIADLRPAPRGAAVAFTASMSPVSDDYQLLVVPLNSAQTAQSVAQPVAAYPDWQADGSSLVYIKAASRSVSDKDLALGAVMSQRVLSPSGAIELGSDVETLAGVMFNPFGRVRCLRDGRILFNAPEVSLPMSTEDYGGDQNEQLFEIDRARRATLTRLIPRKNTAELPQTLSYFEVSPDETQVLFGGAKAEVCLLTLGTGEVSRVQDAASDSLGLPCWRKPGEFSYVRVGKSDKSKPGARETEMVLRSGQIETVLSSSWSDEVLARVIAKTGP